MGFNDGSTEYEEIRKQRLEENKKRMQELGISELSQSLSKSVPITTGKTNRPRAPKDDFPIEVRRSSRVASGPQPDYREAAFDFPLPRRSYSRISRLPRRYASDVERIRAAKRAYKLQEELQTGNPSFVKLMLQSHVSGGFWLGLPLHFCKKHLPGKDEIIVLQDEKGGDWDSIYLAHRTGLSGGWRGFAMDHDLEDGDAIIFELIQPKRFKVHIVRASEVGEDGKDAQEKDKKNVNKSKGGQKRKSEEPSKDPEEADKLKSSKAGSQVKKRRKGEPSALSSSASKGKGKGK